LASRFKGTRIWQIELIGRLAPRGELVIKAGPDLLYLDYLVGRLRVVPLASRAAVPKSPGPGERGCNADWTDPINPLNPPNPYILEPGCQSEWLLPTS